MSNTDESSNPLIRVSQEILQEKETLKAERRAAWERKQTYLKEKSTTSTDGPVPDPPRPEEDEEDAEKEEEIARIRATKSAEQLARKFPKANYVMKKVRRLLERRIEQVTQHVNEQQLSTTTTTITTSSSSMGGRQGGGGGPKTSGESSIASTIIVPKSKSGLSNPDRPPKEVSPYRIPTERELHKQSRTLYWTNQNKRKKKSTTVVDKNDNHADDDIVGPNNNASSSSNTVSPQLRVLVPLPSNYTTTTEIKNTTTSSSSSSSSRNPQVWGQTPVGGKDGGKDTSNTTNSSSGKGPAAQTSIKHYLTTKTTPSFPTAVSSATLPVTVSSSFSSSSLAPSTPSSLPSSISSNRSALTDTNTGVKIAITDKKESPVSKYTSPPTVPLKLSSSLSAQAPAFPSPPVLLLPPKNAVESTATVSVTIAVPNQSPLLRKPPLVPLSTTKETISSTTIPLPSKDKNKSIPNSNYPVPLPVPPPVNQIRRPISKSVALNPDGTVMREGIVDGVKIPMDQFIHIRNLVGYLQCTDNNQRTPPNKQVEKAKQWWTLFGLRIWDALVDRHGTVVSKLNEFHTQALSQIQDWKYAIQEEDIKTGTISEPIIAKDQKEEYSGGTGSSNKKEIKNIPPSTAISPVVPSTTSTVKSKTSSSSSTSITVPSPASIPTSTPPKDTTKSLQPHPSSSSSTDRKPLQTLPNSPATTPMSNERIGSLELMIVELRNQINSLRSIQKEERDRFDTEKTEWRQQYKQLQEENDNLQFSQKEAYHRYYIALELIEQLSTIISKCNNNNDNDDDDDNRKKNSA